MAAVPPSPTVAQMFYDTGKGYNEIESRTIPVTSHSFSEYQRFEFQLPTKDIVGLRFDPLATSGTIIIRDVRIRDPEGTSREIPGTDLIPFNQISRETWDDVRRQTVISTLPEANDPGITIRLPKRLSSIRFKTRSRASAITIGNSVLLIVVVLLYSLESIFEKRYLAGRTDVLSPPLLITLLSRLRSFASVLVAKSVFSGSESTRRLVRIGLVATLVWIIFAAYEAANKPHLQLALDMSSSTSSVAQLFFDVGQGYQEKDSQGLPIPANKSFYHLSFDLPSRTVRNLRFDPLATEGKFVIRNMVVQTPTSVLFQIPASDIKSLNQIATRRQIGTVVAFATVAGANDPGLQITLRRPLDVNRVSRHLQLIHVGLGGLCIFGFALLVFRSADSLLILSRECWQRTEDTQRKVAQIAVVLSDPNFILFDSAAIWFYVICLVCFGMFAIADLNGSSVGIYNSAYGYGVREAPMLGLPRGVRSDEWVCHTPAILNEDLSVDRFDPQQCSLGNHFIALVANVPVRHISTLFRPQFWGFFVLPVDYAFAFYWQFKGFVLIVGIFTAALLLTRSTLWAITGALWYFFSAFTQWTYSWPSALPEMVGLACTTFVSACYLTVARSPAGLILAACLTSFGAIDFVLCGYPPHMIPLIWVVLPLFAAWLLANGKVILEQESRLTRVIAILAVVVICGAVGWVVYRDLRVAIAAVSRTEYPGSRVFSGGSLPFQTLTSHFLQWSETEAHFPPALSNICESTGFLWLAPITLFVLFRAEFTRFQKIAFASLWASFLVILLWLVLPFSPNTGALFGLSGTGGTRALAGLGLTNILIVVVGMSATSHRHVAKANTWAWTSLFPLCGIFIVVFAMLLLTNQTLANFFSWSDVSIGTIAATALIGLILHARRAAFVIALIIPQALLYGGVNPVERGLGVFTDSELYKFVHTHKELMHGRWIVYDEGVVGSGFLRSIGCNVATGFAYIPDIDEFHLFKASGLNPNDFNRDGILLARPLPDGAKRFVEVPIGYAVRLNISPSDPMLKEMGVKYVAFEHKPADSIANQLWPISSGPIGGMWLFRTK